MVAGRRMNGMRGDELSRKVWGCRGRGGIAAVVDPSMGSDPMETSMEALQEGTYVE